jgi:hypothetical protein
MVKLKVVVLQQQAEEPVWWRIKSLLIERHEGHHISFRRYGQHKVLRHMASRELRRRHKPMPVKFL